MQRKIVSKKGKEKKNEREKERKENKSLVFLQNKGPFPSFFFFTSLQKLKTSSKKIRQKVVFEFLDLV